MSAVQVLSVSENEIQKPHLTMVGQFLGEDGEVICRGVPFIKPSEDFELPWYFNGPIKDAERAVAGGRLAEAGAIISRIERTLGITMEMIIEATRGQKFENGPTPTRTLRNRDAISAVRKRNKPPTKGKRAEAFRRAQDFESVGLQADASRLAANAGVVVEREGQENVQRARRMDALDALRSGMETGAYDSARRLERDIIIRRGEHDVGRPPEKVDGALISASNRNDAIIAAAERVNEVLGLVGPRDKWLLVELICPSVQTRIKCDSWRSIVAYITGEETPHGQAAAVRGATSNLRLAYEQVDAKPKRDT